MKIISPFKDYYDYLQGVYGVDPKIIYERISEERASFASDIDPWGRKGTYKPWIFIDKPILYSIAFCGIIYKTLLYQDTYYYNYASLPEKVIKDFGEDAETILTEEEFKIIKESRKTKFKWYRYYPSRWYGKEDFNIVKTDINKKLKCPVLLIQNKVAYVKNPKLNDFQFAKAVSPEQAYLKLTTFLTKEPIVEDTRTNKEKIESYGFDDKTSFRHPIK